MDRRSMTERRDKGITTYITTENISISSLTVQRCCLTISRFSLCRFELGKLMVRSLEL